MVDRVGHQLGNYRLLRELGRGAFAEVYLAEHLYLERLAAIKVLHVQMDPETQEHFRREARTVAHLQHPHILQVLDFGIDEQTPYLVMQYTPGGTLREHHPKGTRLSAEQIVTYVKQIASALDYAHQQRVIHRDVKPHNLLLTATQEVVLGDFGLAVMQRSLDALSLSNPNAGTPLYMAPEQIQYRPCPASDQYALAIMVYEWLAGEAPFDGRTVFEVFSHHLYQAPPSLREQLPDLPAAVEAVVFQALAKDPEQRFACVTDFASAFEDACEITHRLTMPGYAKQRTQEPMVPQSTLFVPPAPVQAAEASSASTQPAPMTVPGTERGQVAVLVADRPTTSKPVKPSLAQNNRQRFLKRVRAIWIEGMLNHSLQGAALIALGLQEQVDALANPWHLVMHHPDTAPRAFPVGTHITEVYDAANEELLILGAPGAGKTTLVLELARDLLDRAEQDEHQLMPVVFPLSSWAAKPQPLTEWMIEELISKYQVPRQLARTWIETDQILPLLDGLDEVATEKRTTCIDMINSYHQEHPFLPLVVSSRSADYLQQSGRLKLTTAVTIQSLTQQQVGEYLAHGGEALWALRVALHQDESLRELAETPLMLSILTLTYHDMPVEDLLQGGIAPTRQQIFDRYVNRMLMHRSDKAPFPPEQTKGWLTWLAKHLVQRGQTVFYLEQLQSEWLSRSQMLRWYDFLTVSVPSVFIGILVTLVITTLLFLPDFITSLLLGGLLGGLLSEGRITQQPAATGGKVKNILWWQFFQRLLIGLLIGISSWLCFGLSLGLGSALSFGLSFGLSSILLQVFLVKSDPTPSRPQARFSGRRTRWHHFIRKPALQNGLLAGLLVGLSYALSYGYGLHDPLDFVLRVGLLGGLSYALSSGFLSLLLRGKNQTIQVTDRLMWSWRRLGQSLRSSRHARVAFQIAAPVGLSYWLIDALSYALLNGLERIDAFFVFGLFPGLIEGLIYALICGLSYWLLIGLFQGVSSEVIEDQQRMTPNQGIHHSGFNGLLLGGISALISGLLAWLLFEFLYTLGSGPLSFRLAMLLHGLLSRLLTSQYSGLLLFTIRIEPGFALIVILIVGISAGVVAGLLKGGLAYLGHYVLRFLLWRNKSMPWNYPRFLDYAAEHILLRKVGGGYIFVHRLQLEYFASLDTTAPSDATGVKK